MYKMFYWQSMLISNANIFNRTVIIVTFIHVRESWANHHGMIFSSNETNVIGIS